MYHSNAPLHGDSANDKLDYLASTIQTDLDAAATDFQQRSENPQLDTRVALARQRHAANQEDQAAKGSLIAALKDQHSHTRQIIRSTHNMIEGIRERTVAQLVEFMPREQARRATDRIVDLLGPAMMLTMLSMKRAVEVELMELGADITQISA
jgi:hypothetical protein